ncbi:MAG: hypothetical protein LBO67_06890, partial [Spirochaetaceae bacterium]|nr:hypothetical protein [Spirochaetaceae bacterium]
TPNFGLFYKKRMCVNGAVLFVPYPPPPPPPIDFNGYYPLNTPQPLGGTIFFFNLIVSGSFAAAHVFFLYFLFST